MLAATNVTGAIIVVLGAVLVALFIGTLTVRHRSWNEGPEVPYTMRPGPSDVALETPLLQRLQGWALLLLVFMIVLFVGQWLFEPSKNLAQEEHLKSLAIARGTLAGLPFSEENQLGVGCVRCHGSELQGGVIVYKDGYAYPPSLQTICAGNLANPPHAAIASIDDIYQVIYQGRNAMPSWSIRYAGALTDQQINDIVMYLVDISDQYVDPADNICRNEDAQKRALEKATTDGTVLERP